MKIDLYTRCWNDAPMIPFFFRHYDALVRKYIVFDDGSTDNSRELLRANQKVDLRQMPAYSDPQSRIASGMTVLETSWKESRHEADWVIVTDIDEHLHHPNTWLSDDRVCLSASRRASDARSDDRHTEPQKKQTQYLRAAPDQVDQL